MCHQCQNQDCCSNLSQTQQMSVTMSGDLAQGRGDYIGEGGRPGVQSAASPNCGKKQFSSGLSINNVASFISIDIGALQQPMPNFTKSWVSQSVLGWCVTCIWLKRGAKLQIILERFLLSPISEKIFASEQSLKETHSFASSFNPRRVTHQSKACRGPYLNSKYLISKNSFGIKRNL